MTLFRLAGCVLLAASLRACTVYEYEHEFWLRWTAPAPSTSRGARRSWTAFKGLGRAEDPEGTATREAARALFERSGLTVKRVTITHRGGRPYLFVSADFRTSNQLAGTPAFPDFETVLAWARREIGSTLYGDVEAAAATRAGRPRADDGLMAVRFHLPSKVHEHRNAVDGVERGNIVGWRQDVAAGARGPAARVRRDHGRAQHPVVDRRALRGSRSWAASESWRSLSTSRSGADSAKPRVAARPIAGGGRRRA